MKSLSACVLLAMVVVLPGCGDKSDRDEGKDSSSTTTTTGFEVVVEGSLPSGPISDCSFTFVVDALPDDVDGVSIDECALAFELSAEIDGPRSMALTNPDGTKQTLPLPTLDDPSVAADDFVGTDAVDGKWTLAFESRFDCDVIESVTLSLSGEHEE